MKLTKDQLLELVKYGLKEYEVFLDDIPTDEDMTLDLLVSNFYDECQKTSEEDLQIALMVSVCVLIYENFKLTYKLHK